LNQIDWDYRNGCSIQNNLLTARVAVNRYWQINFRRWVVDTPDDFGSKERFLRIQHYWFGLAG